VARTRFVGTARVDLSFFPLDRGNRAKRVSFACPIDRKDPLSKSFDPLIDFKVPPSGSSDPLINFKVPLTKSFDPLIDFKVAPTASFDPLIDREEPLAFVSAVGAQ
jgi:hypothetical protein